jgi:hypothetical protein
VTSALGGDVRQLFLRDSQGAYYEAGSPLKAGQSATLKPISANDARQYISQILNDHQPDYPVGYDPAAEDRRADSSWSPRYAYGSVSPTLQASLLEWNLSLFQAPPNDVLEPGSYLALMDSNSDVPLGIAGAKEAKSFHVVLGRW